MVMYIVWYDRKPDFTADFDGRHTGSIRGETPGEIMAQFRTLSNGHDLARFTRLEIIGISD